MFRALTSLLLIALARSADAAEPVVVPEFSFDTNENFAMSVMLQAQVVDGLTEAGHIVLDQTMVAREVGEAAIDRCMENPSCPQAILPQLPAQVAVVVRISREGATRVGHVELWEQSRTSAMEVRDIPINPGNEHLFVQEISQATTDLLGRLPPSTTESLMAAARMISGQSASAGPSTVPAPVPVAPQPSLAPVISPVDPGAVSLVQPAPGPVQPMPAPSYPQPTPVPVQPAPPQPRVTGGRVDYSQTDIRTVLEGTGLRYRHILGAEGNLRNSGMDPRDWLYKATPHGGRLVVEPRIGLGIGDVDRQADVRVEITDGAKTGEWYQEGPVAARRIRGGLFVGYAPVAYFDFGAMVGLQYGKRYFTTGYFRAVGANTDEAASELLSVDAIQFIVQPRARAYIVPTGPAKPFLFIGGDIRMFDNYQIAQPPDVTYPVPVGGVVPGFVAGGGLLIDPSPIVGFFVEGSYIRHFGLRAAAADYLDWAYSKPAAPIGSESTISLIGGVQFRL